MGDQKQGNETVVGEVLPISTDRFEYARDAASHANNPTDVNFIRDVDRLTYANHFARSVETLSGLRRSFALAVGSDSELANEFNGGLAKNSAALDDNLNRATGHLSPEEASKFRQEFMKHHDLMQTTDNNGNKMYIEDPDAKVAQSGDYVPKPEAFAPGNMLEQSSTTSLPPSIPKGPGM